jgi:hypothetical protein
VNINTLVREFKNKPVDICLDGQVCHCDSIFEACYALHLQRLLEAGSILFWQHHPGTYPFEGRKKAPIAYEPDFEVVRRHGAAELHECKGKLERHDVATFRFMQQLYPSTALVLVLLKRLADHHPVRKYVKGGIIYAPPLFKNIDRSAFEAVYEPEHGRRRR